MPGTSANLTAISQTASGQRGTVPKVYFRTADTAAAAGPARVQATVLGDVEEAITSGDSNESPRIVAISIRNTGGPATTVQITGLMASPGWKLAQPPSQPLMVGGIGSNGTAIVAVRLLRDGTGPAPLASVTGTGTLAGASGATADFAIGP
jgi:hypothetical protein